MAAYFFFLGKFDHEMGDQSVIISTDMLKQCVDISITDDSTVEEDEFFQLSITYISRIAANYTPYSLRISEATITIYDDDCK